MEKKRRNGKEKRRNSRKNAGKSKIEIASLKK
jgi:hypothetical protein